jgi:hypothetical protein
MTQPTNEDTLRATAIDFMSKCDVDFGYATGNLNMDTKPENREQIITALVALLSEQLAAQPEIALFDTEIRRIENVRLFLGTELENHEEMLLSVKKARINRIKALERKEKQDG